ncbi:hypothetical protein LIPSTDRAFT_102869 [Lipomyces starkeyi NRRL Y-11557]|uniref:Uncharacterized protein n=1 Tax=Lipomyces starkeyi NRRL Y-11557 TaxID=675824 RepID=A0A1E3QCP7_LIPST|nr:hypothetical protein LIPSTDRAFT_102869 [Lipomyces starkeyi NRRL Y-11557]
MHTFLVSKPSYDAVAGPTVSQLLTPALPDELMRASTPLRPLTTLSAVPPVLEDSDDDLYDDIELPTAAQIAIGAARGTAYHPPLDHRRPVDHHRLLCLH